MPLTILQKTSCVNSCANCPRLAKRSACDPHAACPGYGSSDTCYPLIVLAVHEYLAAAFQLSPSLLRPAH